MGFGEEEVILFLGKRFPFKYSGSRNLELKYGIDDAEYNRLFKLQEGKCAICNRHQIEFTRSLCVDHDHKTGEIRGLLCTNCNLLLGYSKDNKSTLSSAIEYLHK